MSSSARKDATRVTLIGMWLDLLLGITKIVGGLLSQSFALVTDGIHSLTDAVTDIFVLVVARVSHTEPDYEHPYGHGRFETLGTIGMGIVFFTTAGIILFDSAQRLRENLDSPVPALGGIVIAVLSIACKEWIYHYTMAVATRLNSSLLKANAWHSRSDAISSIAVLIGIIGARQGYLWMDTVAAIFVAIIIAKIGWELCADALKELVDTAIPDQRRQQIEHCILHIQGIEGISRMRSRLSGGKILLETHLLVNPRISVSEGHQLGEMASQALTAQFSDIGDVLVHIDPNSEEHNSIAESPHIQQPNRQDILASIGEYWERLSPQAKLGNIELHYLEQGIEVDIFLHEGVLTEPLAKQLEIALLEIQGICKIRIFNKTYDSDNHRQLS